MFKRVMVAVVGIPLLLVILGWAPEGATMLLTMGMCAIGAWELMHAVAGEGGKPLLPLTAAAAALVPVCVYLEMAGELDTLLKGEKTGVIPLSLVLLGVDVVMDATLQLVRKGEAPLLEIQGVTPSGR